MDEQVVQEAKKRARLGNKSYTVSIAETYIAASVYTYTLGGNYGNGYGDEYIIYRPKKCAKSKVTISSWNNTWACRSHGMNDSWCITEVVDASAAHEFIQQVENEFNAINDDATADADAAIRDLALKIRDFVADRFDSVVDTDDD